MSQHRFSLVLLACRIRCADQVPTSSGASLAALAQPGEGRSSHAPHPDPAIHLPSQARIIELEMQNSCKDAAEKFAALDLNWWTCNPAEVIGPDLQEMRNIQSA